MSKFNKLKLRNIGFLNSPQRRVASYGNSGSDDSDGSNDNHGSIDDNGSYGNNYGSSEGNYGSDGSSLTGGFGFDEEDCMPQEVYYALLENGTTVSGVYVCELGWTIPEVVDTEKSGCSWDDGGSEAWGSSGYDPWFGSSLSGSSLYGSSLYGSSTSRGGGETSPTYDKKVNLPDKAKVLIKENKNLNKEQMEKLLLELQKMQQDCHYKAIQEYLTKNDFLFNGVEMNDKEIHPVVFEQVSRTLIFRDIDVIQYHSLSHETFHLFQKYLGSYDENKRLLYEFEQKLFHDIMFYHRNAVNGKIPYTAEGGVDGYAILTNLAPEFNDTYREWLYKVTENGIPDSISEEDIKWVFGIFGAHTSYGKEEKYDPKKQYDFAEYGFKAMKEGFKLAKDECKVKKETN